MKIKKIISSLLLIPVMYSTYSFKSSAENITQNNNTYDFKEIIIKNSEVDYKNITNDGGYLEGYGDISFGKNTVAILSLQHNQEFFTISIFDNKSLEKQNEVTLNGYLRCIIEADDGYLIFAVKNNSLFLYKISEYGKIVFDKKIIDSVGSVYVDISDIKVFKDNMALIVNNEIILLSINGEFENKINSMDLIGRNDIDIASIFDTGTNYTVLAGSVTDDYTDIFFVNISYDGLYQDKIKFPEGIVPVNMSMLNINEYIFDFVDFNTNTYGLIKMDNNGNVLSRLDYPSNIESEHWNVFNNDNIYSIGTEVDLSTFKSSTKLSQYDMDLNRINKYIINFESITNTTNDFAFVALYNGTFIQDRIFIGVLSSINLFSSDINTYLFSVDLDEVDAVNAIDIAIDNPNKKNMELARKLVNNIKESDKKEELQNRLNEINISLDLEKNSSTANLDIYIKSESMLSMSLDTNLVTFNGYTGTEPLEKLDVVNITINSSLPYDLNAYMPTEITNSDRTNTMDISILNIREGNETIYQKFENTTDKVVLKSDCASGNNINHSIDLKLDSNNAYVPDVYKTVIKFEAEQK